MSPRAGFTCFQESTREDWQLIAGEFMAFANALPDRVLAHLTLPEGDCGGFPIDRMAHDPRGRAVMIGPGLVIHSRPLRTRIRSNPPNTAQPRRTS